MSHAHRHSMSTVTTSPAAASAAAGDHPRLLLRGFLSYVVCKVDSPENPLGDANPSSWDLTWCGQELEFVHRSCGTVGYRPSVLSTTLSHLAATGCSHLLLPFVPLRDRLRDAVESFFSCHFDLFVEFTALISWCKGASIGWHSDDNKPYLKQRAFTAVCYLNSHGKDYKGGILRFQDGEPSSVVPVAGDVVIYTADHRNVHSVDEVTEGERLTLTLWFTRDSAYNEDPKLIRFLTQTSLSHELAQQNPYLPLPASDNMYWYSHGQSGFDIRSARVHMLGFSFHLSGDGDSKSFAPAEGDPLELLAKPLRLGRGDDIFETTFVNSLHALQVVQFYYWKALELAARRIQDTSGSGTVCYPIICQSRGMKLALPCNHELAESILGSCNSVEFSFEWNYFALAVAMWERYAAELKRKLSTFLPYWLSNETIFDVNSCETQAYN